MVRTNSLDFDKPVHVLLYHPWLEGFPKYFEAHLSWLRGNGFESLSLEDLLQYLRGERMPIPERPVVMTFDDGTIENYTIVYPLLKKYGFAGTVFAPTANEYIKTSGTDWWKEVDGQGILKIEGHSHTHAVTFIDDQIEDFYIGEEQDRGPHIKGLDKRLGAPIFKLGYELVSQRFFPKRELMDICVNYVKQTGGKTFFEREDWRGELFRVVSEYRKNRGHFETEVKKRQRIKEELELSKTIIEETIENGKEVRFFAYPFGAYDSDLIESVKNLGYKSAFTTDLGGNNVRDDPFRIKRMMIVEENSFGGLFKIFKDDYL